MAACAEDLRECIERGLCEGLRLEGLKETDLGLCGVELDELEA